jgi:hypothetical protein
MDVSAARSDDFVAAITCLVCGDVMSRAKKRLPIPNLPLLPQMGPPFTHDVYVAYFVCPRCLSVRTRIEAEKDGELVATVPPPETRAKSFGVRLCNAHLLPAEELQRYLVLELSLNRLASSEEERRIVYALSENEEGLELDSLQQLTELPEGILSAAVERLRYKKLVEWYS